MEKQPIALLFIRFSSLNQFDNVEDIVSSELRSEGIKCTSYSHNGQSEMAGKQPHKQTTEKSQYHIVSYHILFTAPRVTNTTFVECCYEILQSIKFSKATISCMYIGCSRLCLVRLRNIIFRCVYSAL